TFYSFEDIQKLEKFMKGKPVAEQEIGQQLLLETVAYAESSVCRRKQLLYYFGEVYKEDNCQNCDNCTHPKTKFEGMDDVALVLETALEVKEKFKAKHLIAVITGTTNGTVKSYKHNELEVFGKGIEDGKEEKFWTAVVRQTIIAGLLTKDIESYGTLYLSKAGKDFLKKPHSIMLTKDHDYENADGDDDDIISAGGQKGGSGADEVLFAMLKDLCKKTAKQHNLPPYVVFQEVSLEEMAIQYPIKMDELIHITGVGTGKAQKFGKPFLALIEKYVEENEIERPQDLVVKSIVNKSGLKVHIIQNIDRKLRLEDIAKAKGLSITELISEIESIVSSGTRVNISYYIEDVIDEDKQDEVYEYFRTAPTDSVDAAIKELGEDDYTEEEIRLMRIKFISEFGN
ncbi:MAG TPA: RQC domain-containing protein, partial [Bacteroidia bacterium]|nr:RQC domain-containing protein [Bacteroidia bacterium]